MINRIELKKDAKEKLKGNLGESIKIILLLFAISFISGFVFGIVMGILHIYPDSFTGQLITDLISIIISGLFSFGVLSFFVKLSRRQEVTYKELFSKTNMLIKFIIASILISIVVSVGCILLIIPGIILSFGLSQTMYIILDDPEIKTIDAMKKSYAMMKGYKMKYFILSLSFMGWVILGIFTFGILYLWLIPYMSIAQANFYNKVKFNYEQKNIG